MKSSQLKMPRPDMVNRPPHYTAGKVECIDALEAMSSPESFVDFCVLTATKYLWRWRHKAGVEDMKKARWYLDRALKAQEAAK